MPGILELEDSPSFSFPGLFKQTFVLFTFAFAARDPKLNFVLIRDFKIRK